MTISIPVALALNSTDVIDTTQMFNPNEHLSSYPAGVKYQHEYNIYQNTGVTIPIKDYILADESGYLDGQIIYKDGANTAHYYLSGNFPKQPDNYTEVQNTGFDASAWTTRYSKLQSIPAGFINTKIDTGLSTYSTLRLSPDGTKGFSIANHDLFGHTLSEAYNPSTAVVATSLYDYTHTHVNACNKMCINAAGTKVIGAGNSQTASYQNYVMSFNLPTAWVATGATVTGTKVLEGFGGWVLGDMIASIEMNTTGTQLYVLWQTTSANAYWQVFNFGTAYDVDTLTYSTQYTLSAMAFGIASAYAFLEGNIIWLDSGNKYAIKSNKTGSYQMYIFSVSTPYTIDSSSTLISTKVFSSQIVNYFFNGDGTKVWVKFEGYSTKYYLYYLGTAWNISTALHNMNDYDTIQINGDLLTQWKFKTVNGVLTSYVTMCSKSAGTIYINTSTNDATFYTFIDSNSIEKDAAYPITDGTHTTFMIKTLIWTSTGIYVRTNIARYAEFEALSYHAYLPIVSPLDIPQFALIGATNDYAPFDGKNYSSAKATGLTMNYIVTGEVPFDTLALGGLLGDSVTAVFKLPDDTIIDTINRTIDRSIDSLNNIDGAYTTTLFYSSQVMPAGSIVEISITNTTDNVELGTIMLGQSVGAGFTNLSLKHSYKDFSIAEYDTWGNLDYVERQRISTYNGSVDINITDYDRVIRLFTHIGKKLVIVNGSTSKINTPDSQNIFASTQKIGRFMSFNQQTNVKDEDMERLATYTFTLEELA